jgi:hypothetical protein
MKCRKNPLTLLTVKGEFEDLHRWVKAPDDVKFLRDLHRHMFEVEMMIQVSGDDRELEFIQIKRWFQKDVVPYITVYNRLINNYRTSCEQFCKLIIEKLQEKFGSDRYYYVSVREDGENGAIVCTE